MNSSNSAARKDQRSPVHVVYGGADRFTAATPRKLGDIALRTLHEYVPNEDEFAGVFEFRDSSDAAAVFQKVISKLETEPVEDFRIDFEDGYGFRADLEEDEDAKRSAVELALLQKQGPITPFCGFRVKSLQDDTRERALRTLELFLTTLVENTGGQVPPNIAIALPKITAEGQVAELCDRLDTFESEHGIFSKTIGLELMVETPQSIFDESGSVRLRRLVEAARGRCTSAHFGAFDYTSALGIVSTHQGLNHPACELARQLMLVNLAPLGIRLSDSVTTVLPVAIHRSERLDEAKRGENRGSILAGWREHFANVTRSMQNGFFQSWDLHPNQLVARYAAVYAFYIGSFRTEVRRLEGFIARATRATLTGNTFDDAASARGLLNFFRRGIDCDAFTGEEVKEALGSSLEEASKLLSTQS